MTRTERRLLTTLRQHSHYIALGAIECAIAGQFLHSGLFNIAHDKRATAEERAFCLKWLPFASQACREPFAPMPVKLGDALINASADACRAVKDRVYGNATTMPISYFYTLYFWLTDELERGTLVLHNGSAFDQAWKAVSEQMLKYESIMDEAEKACRKRARRYGDVLREFGLFAGQPQRVAA